MSTGTDKPAAPRVGDDILSRALSGFRGTEVVLRTRMLLEDNVVSALRTRLSALAGHEVTIVRRVDPRMPEGAILSFGADHDVVLDPGTSWVDDLERTVTDAETGGRLRSPGDTYRLVRKLMDTVPVNAHLEDVSTTGVVVEVGDDIARVEGLRGVGSQEVVEFENGIYGVAFSLARTQVGCVLLGSEEGLGEGAHARRTGRTLSVPVGEQLLGRVVNALGQPVDGRTAPPSLELRPVERKAPGVVQRRPVDTPLHTGTKVVDALAPLGRGQRELVIGDRRTGKTTLAVDAILSQLDTGVRCVYVAIGQKTSSVVRVVKTLEDYGAMAYTTVVLATPGEPPAFRHMAPYTGCAMAEYFMDKGQDALIVYDDLTKHAVTYREISVLLEHPIGREAYPGDIFYEHSRLLERAARLSEENGGGSLTAIPIIETQAGDISAFIPTNVVSICDGQIFLDAGTFNEGHRPAMQVGLSVSRVGGAAQLPAMKKVAGRLRVDLAQYQEMAQFVKFGAEVDEATRRQLVRGERARELLRQDLHDLRTPAQEIVVLFAAVHGLLDDVPLERIADTEQLLLASVARDCPDIMDSLRDQGELPADSEPRLTQAVAAFVAALGVTAAEPSALAEAAAAQVPEAEGREAGEPEAGEPEDAAAVPAAADTDAGRPDARA